MAELPSKQSIRNVLFAEVLDFRRYGSYLDEGDIAKLTPKITTDNG